MLESLQTLDISNNMFQNVILINFYWLDLRSDIITSNFTEPSKP